MSTIVKRMMMAAAASGESQWILQYKAGDDTYFMNVQPDSTYSAYYMQLTTRGNGGTPDRVGIVGLTPDGSITYERHSDSSYPASSGGRTHYKGAYGFNGTFYAGGASYNTAFGKISTVDYRRWTPNRNYSTIFLETHKDNTSQMYFGDLNFLRSWGSTNALEMPRASSFVRDAVASPSAGAVYALQVGDNQAGYVGKIVNANLAYSASSKAAGYETGTISFMFYDGRSASLALKYGASSGYLYAQGGDRIIRFNTNGDSTTTTMSVNSFWRLSGSPQGIYSLGTIRFDNNSGNNILYWIGNSNSTTATTVQVVKMDQSGNVLGSYNINANTGNYSTLRMSLTNGYGSGFTISETGLLVFGITARRTADNSLRALLIKCDFDNLPNLAGFTDTNGSEVISSVTSAGVSRSGLTTPTEGYGWTAISDTGDTTKSLSTIGNIAITSTTKLVDLS